MYVPVYIKKFKTHSYKVYGNRDIYVQDMKV